METKKLKCCVQKYGKPEIGAVVLLLQETGKMCVAQFSSHINGAVGDNPDQYYWDTIFVIDRYDPNRIYRYRESRPYKETDTWVRLSVIFDSMKAASGLKTDAVIVETTEEKEDDWTSNATLQKISEYIEKVICPRINAVEDTIKELNEKLEQNQSNPTIIPTPYPTPNISWPWPTSPVSPYYTQPTVWPRTFEVTCKAPNP